LEYAADMADAAHVDPKTEYATRLATRQAEAQRLLRLERTIGNQRLAVFIIGLAIGWFSWGTGTISGWWLLVPLAVYLALAKRHEGAIQGRQRAQRSVAYYEQGIRRIEDRWQGNGVAGTRFLDPAHPYAPDIDIFGIGSLFELLCTARTQAGEARLAAWLSAPAAPEVVRARQEAIRELTSRLDLREDLTALGEQARAGLKPEALAVWGAGSLLFPSKQERRLALLLAAIPPALLVGWAVGMGPTPFIVALAVNGLFLRQLGRRVREVVHSVDKLSRELELFAGLLARLEAEECRSPLLKVLQASIKPAGVAASMRVSHLQGVIELLELPHNVLLRPLNVIVLWSAHCAFVIDAWRAEDGPRIAAWLHAVAEWEALCSLACYAYEHPDDVYPELVDGDACFVATGMAHPLLPAAHAVRNDVGLSVGNHIGQDRGEQGAHRLYIVSGSNMSGKSTLMRTVGVNTVLALAGSPVRAHHLRLTPLHIGASIQTQDSLQAGISRFYAEILRLRQIIDMTGAQPPLLFLLDEILHGTNSHDRRIGAEAVIRTLAARNAIGFVTTHDLALAAIASDPILHAINVHFEDQLQDGKMTFDYQLRPGVVNKSNAIELMRAVGLEV
jgi:hypothetical protein